MDEVCRFWSILGSPLSSVQNKRIKGTTDMLAYARKTPVWRGQVERKPRNAEREELSEEGSTTRVYYPRSQESGCFKALIINR